MVQKIPKFDCDAVTPNAIFLLVGRRRSGKSVNLMSLLHRFRNTFAWGCVICPSQTSLKDYSNVMPPQFCHESIDLDLIQKMIDYQNKRVKNNCAERIFLVLDDCAFDVKAFKSKVLKYLFFNSRHLKITLFISIQDCLVLSPALRANVDFVLASREKGKSYRQRFFDAYGICFNSFKEFDKIFRALTENFHTMVLAAAAATQSDAVEDNVFSFKSTFPLPEFKMSPDKNWWRTTKFVRNPTVKIVSNDKREEKKVIEKKVDPQTFSVAPIRFESHRPERKLEYKKLNFNRKFRKRFTY